MSLVLHAPAQQLARWLPPTVGVMSWGGTVMNGQFSGAFKQQPLYVSWNWQLSSLLLAKLAAETEVRGAVNGNLAVSSSLFGWQATLQRFMLDSGNWMILPPGTQMPQWQSAGINIERSSDGEWLAADGVLTTVGGAARLMLQGQVQELTLPAATMTLRIDKGSLVAELTQTADKSALARLSLSADNRLEWRVRDRLLRFNPKYISANEPDVEVLTVSEPL